MAFCPKCGAQVAAGATFCSACGAAQGTAGGAGVAAGTGLDENIAGAISYAGIWVTGLIFFLTDKRSFVRFHAAQSIVLWGGISILYFVVFNIIFGVIFRATGFLFFGSAFGLLADLLGLLCFGLWILCMVKAYQKERFKLPIVGDIAENIAGK